MLKNLNTFTRFGRQIGRNFSSVTATSSNAKEDITQVHDFLQEQALKENCILVDNEDNAIGAASKADCHRVDKKTGAVKLHRAFSVFLFNEKGEMLVQRRSVHKITFPDTYTNACCSHPLFDIENERTEENAYGIRRAAQRRLNYELGIPTDQIEPDNFHFLTRIHYANTGDGKWGEHEIDYILFLQKDVDLQPNSNEVSDIKFLKRSEIDMAVSRFDAPLTPWFKLILHHRLKTWWDNLHQLNKFEDHKTIHRFA
ncbi:isopentenyl-diphosphate Delta-isomerase 1 [Teleopsis dalmanni]|uniref:isopentenyl-diphosphate Delta-isomerase 1-like n=1 Tax=Teleopsis dalmanni TaxID=139649 RepID=UPI000D32D26D|nr:isopentenyl-diphosphate Delta-isomerase 1-like [Teleopsis dalmanni]XP_037946206.1 isopentenyl-diphosphate Delta-isomerase 1 [Teleopsis dalmanni]